MPEILLALITFWDKIDKILQSLQFKGSVYKHGKYGKSSYI